MAGVISRYVAVPELLVRRRPIRRGELAQQCASPSVSAIRKIVGVAQPLSPGRQTGGEKPRSPVGRNER